MSGFVLSNKSTFALGYVCMIFAFIFQVFGNLVLPFVPRWLRYRRKDIEGQKILITGAGNGLGRELAVQFSKYSTCLILVDINGQSLWETEKLLDKQSTVFTYECDVSDYKKVCEMAAKVKKDAGDVDILVNNAGVVSGRYLVDLSEEEIVRTMNVNALAHFWTVKAFLPAMRERDFGHIVSIASACGKVTAPKMTDYCSSKYATIGFAESLEIELRKQKLNGIKVTIVCTSHIDTGLFDGFRTNLGTILTPEYAAKEILLGILEEQELINIPKFIKFLYIFKECFPRWLIIKAMELTGNMKVMDNFTGRQIKEVNKRGEAG